MADQSKHQEITERILRDWDQSEYSRDNGSRDLIFARRTQWDDELDENVSTEYRGQFDIVKPERRRILASLMKNEFNNRYRAKTTEDEKLAEVLQNYYRATVRTNDARMAQEVAVSEAIDCGVGAWRLEVVDEDERDPLNTNKKIVRSVIHEANNKVVWDANSKKIDKSDAKRCAVIFAYASDAWKELMNEHGLSDVESQFELPDYIVGSSLCWRESENYTIAEYYHIKETKQKMTIMSDGDRNIALTTGELKKKGDALKSQGWEKEATKTVINKTVWKTVLTGSHILSNNKIAGRHIPVIPIYGEWSITQSTETWEGLVRMLRDPQQMKNTTLSYIFDLLAKGPIEKDIYFQEQIDGYEEMYEKQNTHDFAYYLMNRTDAQGNELPREAIGKKGGPSVPQAAQFLLGAADQAVQQSVGGGITPEQMINPQVTDDQLQTIKEQLDIQSQLYKDHLEYSYRREGEVCASIWSEIIDNERTLNVMSVDGTESTVDVNKVSTDLSTMSMSIEVDMRNADMDVFTDVGVSFSTQKDKVRNEMMALLEKPITPDDQKIAQWTYTMNLEGSAYKPMRDNARKQMVLAGYIDEDDLTEEEEEMVEQSKAQQQDAPPDPMMVAAQAEQTKADAQMMGEQTDSKKAEIDMFNAETNRMKVQLEAEALGIELQDSEANVQNKNANTAKVMRDIQSKDVDDMVKVQDSQAKQRDSYAKMLSQPIAV
jgi:hypothetical protein